MIPNEGGLPDVPLLKTQLARRYDLGAIAECVVIGQSFNDVYRVEAGAGRFLLRVSGIRSQAATGIAYEIDLLRHLAASGIPVAAPVATRDGGFVWDVDPATSTRTAVLFTYAPGEHPVRPFPSVEFGRTAAALHEALDDFIAPTVETGLDWRYLVDEPIAAVRSFVRHRSDIGDYLTLVAAALHRRLAELEQSLEIGACHGDLHPRNSHLATDGTITLFDFECCGPGWRAYELAVLRWWQRFTGQPEEYWTTYLEAYQERRRLGPADLAAIPLFVAIRHIRLLGGGAWLALDGFKAAGGWRPDDQHFDRRLRSLAGWLAEHDDLASGVVESLIWPVAR